MPMTTADKTDSNSFKHLTHPLLILIRGVPGSGKSYLAAALQDKIGAGNVVILDPDKIDLTSQAYLDFSDSLTKEGVDLKFHPYRWSRAKAYKGIETNKVIMWNQAFTNLDGFNKTVINLQGYAADHGTTLPLLSVEVEVNEPVARQRVAKRAEQGGHGVPDEAFARFMNEYTSFADTYNTVVVHGEDDVEKSVAAVLEALEKLK